MLRVRIENFANISYKRSGIIALNGDISDPKLTTNISYLVVEFDKILFMIIKKCSSSRIYVEIAA